MTPLRQRMLEEVQRLNCTVAETFGATFWPSSSSPHYFHKSPELGNFRQALTHIELSLRGVGSGF